MRQIVLDTETTGLRPEEGHRIIEIGAVEVIKRKLTGRTFHVYINPQRVVEQEAIDVHGITNDFLQDKPVFAQIAEEFIDFIQGAELVIHNAPFDVGFMDHEFALLRNGTGKTIDYCSVLDTLKLSQQMRPGQRHTLDALCRAYGVDNSNRTFHGALLDAELLADVYLLMTGGQTALELPGNRANGELSSGWTPVLNKPALKVVQASAAEQQAHQQRLALINDALWQE
ncbi:MULTISPECIES: DNA polymerase III subunit epsilon [Idiomarinaceae]|uniref:DNA polymerase III subunit epsilon n=3 Tax=Pseudidiomarina TaxID=2800384 RepID=A0A368V0D2_9GAMM|nr:MULTISPECIES: DNA polymerase III subunit epsilon [Idiomarinaceae]MDT7524590.1 DNA polymerase III subunit epsilon [Pseudidiomarina sp. GXY010]MDX1525427.1 DNA polymerase III subunit epsilon [Pseudidiomarina maritima]MRJ42708.1 DNA polymerase III subunit epsilon [Idiomarina sp. FeN1]NCU58272.1 DNA polymerase III subunit epsilon [Idiomarina sp. FenA--70]NCU60970.1 DNA polymerase III subunit epsilon [Idiomarina sp. FenBw--71]